MINKISTESTLNKYHANRYDSEEFETRVSNLLQCVYMYTEANRSETDFTADLKRVNINQTCSRQFTQLKEFINNTGAKYENVYSPITSDILRTIESANKSI